MKILRVCIFLCGLLSALSAAENAPNEASREPSRYRLFPRDLVKMSVHGEPDVSGERRIDGLGEVSVPLIGQVKIAGLTTAEAQELIAKLYVEQEIYVRPEVLVTVVDYSPKEVMVLGQVGKQGKQLFPPEASSVSIVEAITSAGGFTRIAKSDGVKVTRKDERGAEQAFTVNVEKMVEGRSSVELFMLQPGDVIFVPERVF